MKAPTKLGSALPSHVFGRLSTRADFRVRSISAEQRSSRLVCVRCSRTKGACVDAPEWLLLSRPAAKRALVE